MSYSNIDDIVNIIEPTEIILNGSSTGIIAIPYKMYDRLIKNEKILGEINEF